MSESTSQWTAELPMPFSPFKNSLNMASFSNRSNSFAELRLQPEIMTSSTARGMIVLSRFNDRFLFIINFFRWRLGVHTQGTKRLPRRCHLGKLNNINSYNDTVHQSSGSEGWTSITLSLIPVQLALLPLHKKSSPVHM